LKKNTNYQFVFKKKKECCLALFGKDNYRDDDKSLWQTANNISKITINTGDSENLNIGINWNGTSSFLMFLTYKQI